MNLEENGKIKEWLFYVFLCGLGVFYLLYILR